jgi:chromosome partitioning protein
MLHQNATPPKDKGYVIVLGNEKGGTGKSTASMHLITHLLRLGFSVGTIDSDARQGTLSRYIENRIAYCKANNLTLALPDHHPIYRSQLTTVDAANAEEESNLLEIMDKFKAKDFIVIDTPGTDSHLSRLAHSYADLLITPLNDSFVDLDMLGRIDPDTYEVLRPSTYAEMVWEQKKQRALRREPAAQWIVMRNRLSSLYAKNKEEMQKALDSLAKRVGFKTAQGFGERVIFRELFLKGLTVLDLEDAGIPMNISHIGARQELRRLLESLGLSKIDKKLETEKTDALPTNVNSIAA